MDNLARETVTFSLEHIATRLGVDRDLLADLHSTGGFAVHYDEAEWCIPSDELHSFLGYLLERGTINQHDVIRLRDRRAGHDPERGDGGTRRGPDRRQSQLDSTPRRRISDYVSA